MCSGCFPPSLRFNFGNERWGVQQEDRKDDDRRLHHNAKMTLFLHDAVDSLEKRTQARDPSFYPSSAFVSLLSARVSLSISFVSLTIFLHLPA